MTDFFVADFFMVGFLVAAVFGNSLLVMMAIALLLDSGLALFGLAMLSESLSTTIKFDGRIAVLAKG